MTTYWHVTLTADVPSILQHGLQPRIGPRSREVGETVAAVYLFPDVSCAENACVNWLGEVSPDGTLTLLVVKDVPVHPGAAEYELLCLELIPPDRIEVINSDI